MNRSVLLLTLFSLLLLGCNASSDAAPDAADSAAAPSAAPASAPGDAQDLPPSRAGDAQPAEDYETAFSNIVQQIVTDDGLVRYDLLEGQLGEKFRRVLKAVETYDAGQLDSQSEKVAFWINAYNVQMLQTILETPGVEDVSAHNEDFFKTPLRTAGMAASLDEIENVILRRKDGPARLERLQPDSLDYRLHAGINCAAQSCPRLRTEAFTPGRVDDQLDAAMRDFVSSPQHFAVEDGASEPQYTINSIVKWFGSDFDLAGQPAGDTLLRYMPTARPGYAALKRLLGGRTAAEIAAQPGVTFAYDWTLNRKVGG